MVLRSFQLNPGSGGQGLYKGGDGVIRELVFRRPLTLSILSERRAFCPYGLEGIVWKLQSWQKFRGHLAVN